MVQIGDLRIWWTNNKVKFEHDVKSINEAVLVLKVLAEYDMSLGDYISWNASGLCRFERDYTDDGTPVDS